MLTDKIRTVFFDTSVLKGHRASSQPPPDVILSRALSFLQKRSPAPACCPSLEHSTSPPQHLNPPVPPCPQQPLRGSPPASLSLPQVTWCDLAGTLFTRPSVSEGDFCGACLTGDIKLSDVLQLTRWQSRVCTTMFKRHKRGKQNKRKNTKTSGGKVNVADDAKINTNRMDSEMHTVLHLSPDSSLPFLPESQW